MKLRIAHGLILLLALAGCATDQKRREAQELLAEGKTEEGLIKLQDASKAKPDDMQLRIELARQRGEAINDWFARATAARNASDFDEAEANYQHVLQFEPNNERALDGLTAINKVRRSQGAVVRAQDSASKGDWDKTLSLTHAVLENDPANSEMLELKQDSEDRLALESQELPTLRSLYRKPVSLQFRDANLKMIFELLSKDTGINFILDKEVRSDLKATIFIKRAALEDAVDLLLSTNQLEKKILNQNTVLIYPGTPGKVKEYQDLVMKGFYLSSADVKQVQSMIKTMLNAKNVNIDERLRLLVIRDTPETVRLAEKIIAMQDISEPEVMLEVEVLEVQRSKLLDLGIQFPNQLSLTPLASNGKTLTLNDLKNLNSKSIGAAINPAVINAKREDGIVNLLANPRIRARNHEKAKILIGDKVPVITTTSTSTGFVSESVQYVDVGLKLEFEPDIYLHDDIAIKVALEVSSIVKEVRSNTGTLTYQIGTRNASSLLQLKDGETQVLAGLINNQDNATVSKIPGLSDIPLIGRLFTNENSSKQKTEIVLSITPHLIRNIRRPQEALGFWTGTDERLRTRPLTLQSIAKPVKEELPVTNAEAPMQEAQLTSVSLNAADKVVEAAVMNLSWQAPPAIKVGELFKASLMIKSNGGLRSLPIQLGFDPKVLQVIEVSEGDFFKQDGAKTLSNSNIDQAGGRVFAGIARTGTTGAAGSASLLTVTFKATASAAQSELKVIAATPVSADHSTVSPVLPAPLSLTISN